VGFTRGRSFLTDFGGQEGMECLGLCADALTGWDPTLSGCCHRRVLRFWCMRTQSSTCRGSGIQVWRLRQIRAEIPRLKGAGGSGRNTYIFCILNQASQQPFYSGSNLLSSSPSALHQTRSFTNRSILGHGLNQIHQRAVSPAMHWHIQWHLSCDHELFYMYKQLKPSSRRSTAHP